MIHHRIAYTLPRGPPENDRARRWRAPPCAVGEPAEGPAILQLTLRPGKSKCPRF
jgi:hypothetical protein